MARRTAYESCMFCEPGAPCEMHQPKATPSKRTRKAPPSPAQAGVGSTGGTGKDGLVDITSVIGAQPPAALSSGDAPTPPAQKQGVHAAMRARAAKAPAPAPVADEVTDPVMDDAIRALEPLLHPIEKRTHQAVLTQPRTIVTRANNWRAKRRGN